jgi:rhodanese-related sulfurtransferase
MDILDKEILKGLTILIGLALIVAFGVNFISPRGIGLIGQWDESAGVVTAKGKDDVVLEDLEIDDVRTAIKIYNTNKAVFIDARQAEDYAEGHIKDALSFPVNQFDEQIDAFKKQYALDMTIITYCSGRTCTDSHKLAQLLLQEGYENVAVFIDGYQHWKEEGGAVEE